MRCLFRFGAGFAAVLTAAACGAPAPAPPPPAPQPVPAAVAPARVTAALARQIGADELGRVPVLMYHRLTAQPRSVYDRTPADFTAELERLAAEDYVPVTTADLVARRLDLPAGAHPVVLTFDDGDPSAFSLTPQGQPAPGTAVRILLDVAAAHPRFRPVASLYVNEHPFGEAEDGRALRWLAEHQFEIGNHTRQHTNLRTASESEVTAAITEEDAAIRRAGYQPTTLALPYGTHPRRPELALRGPGYSYGGALLVGAGPAPSPCSTDFEPGSIPRIRSQSSSGKEAEYGSAHWLDELASPTGHRYTSDGDPATVSYPRSGPAPAPACASVGLAY
jgi:peptidoglycan/xylan/chitin deacetylase (PgdA/CDA1 family)